MLDAEPSRKRINPIIICVVILIVVLAVLVPLFLWILAPNYVNEEITIILHHEGTDMYSVWLPILNGSPLFNPQELSLSDGSIQIVQSPNGTFLNISTTGDKEIKGSYNFRGRLNESYLRSEWTGNWTLDNQKARVRAFASGNVTITLRYRAWSDYCYRYDDLSGTVQGDGSWTLLNLTRDAVCM